MILLTYGEKTAFFPYRFIQKTRIIMVSIEEEDEEEELTTTEAMSEKMCEELEAMQSLTHEEIVEKILAVTKKNNDGENDEELEKDDVMNDADDDDLTGHEGTKFAMIIAQGMRASLARHRLKKEIERREEQEEEVSASDETFLRKLRKKVYQNWKPDMPSLQRDVDEQEERNQMLERRKEKAKEKERRVETHQRGALLKALPNDGKSIQRKKEGTKMKKRDPEAQGGAFERRKMHEEGAGLFVAPMMPEKANREVAKTTRKSAGKGWFDLPAAEYTPELKRDMRTLKLRGAFDPKRFYKNADTRKLPTHFSIGTVVEGAQDFHSARLTKKEKGRTFAEEIAKDQTIKKARTTRFTKVQNEKKGSGGDKRKSNTNSNASRRKK
jgi:hypothetical protein